MYYSFEVSRQQKTLDWRTYQVAFENKQDYDRYLAGEPFTSFDQSTSRRKIVHPPDGQIREANPISTRSEDEAIKVAKDALANQNNVIHDQVPLDPATPINVVDETTGERRQIS